jgi:enamine deaminase RidA (YjgF/YER057c/UK114 family)
MTVTRLHAGPRMSQAVIHGSTIYLAGQVADQAKGKSVGDQTKEILATIERLLDEAGSDKTKILSTTIYLADIATFAEMNAEWDAWALPVTRRPARPSRPSSQRRLIPSRSPASRPGPSRP